MGFAMKFVISCIISLILTKLLLADHFLPFPSINLPIEYPESHMEDEIEYTPLTDNEGANFDWSPPNGELPNENVADSLSLGAYVLGEDKEDGGLDLSESWIEPDNGLEERVESKRAFDFLREKKNQVLCRVQRVIHRHIEAGHEFFPKSYASYSCHPVTGTHLEGLSMTSHDTCYVTGDKCISIEKEQLFLKRRHNTNCWSHFIEAVGAGCKCLSRKY